MSKETLTAFVHAELQTWSDVPDDYKFTVWGFDASHSGYIPVGRVEVEFETPTVAQIKARHLVLLKAKKAQMYDEFNKQLADIDEQVHKLESLTYTPTPPEETF